MRFSPLIICVIADTADLFILLLGLQARVATTHNFLATSKDFHAAYLAFGYSSVLSPKKPSPSGTSRHRCRYDHGTFAKLFLSLTSTHELSKGRKERSCGSCNAQYAGQFLGMGSCYVGAFNAGPQFVTGMSLKTWG